MKSLFYGFALAAILLACYGYFLRSDEKAKKELGFAESLYKQGLLAKDAETESSLLNEALAKLLEIREPSPALEIALGDALFHLGEYPLALYHYRQALLSHPKDESVLQRIQAVLNVLALPPLPTKPAWEKWALGSVVTFPSLEKITLLFFGLVIFTASCWISCHNKLLQWALVVLLVPTVYLFLCTASLYYFSPIEGVLIRSSLLRQGAGLAFPQVAPQPLPAGSSLILLDVDDEGKWLKVRSQNGVMGYIQQENLRVLIF